MKCKNCKSVDLVHSGVDAFCLGVEVGKYCYPCANYEAFKREALVK